MDDRLVHVPSGGIGRASRREHIARRVLREVSSLLIVVAVVLAARSSLADHYFVPSGSMEPTVRVGDHVLVNKLAYGLHVPLLDRYAVEFGTPSPGDVVVLRSPVDDIVLLKRVVAGPGDVVRVTDGALELNGARVALRQKEGQVFESLGDAPPHKLGLDMGGGPDFGPVRVPPGHFLVLGDHRGNSNDGRFFGFVSRDEILGRTSAVCFRDGAITWLAL